MRYVLIAHRYLAVATGLLMTLWCLSGFVMMYQAFPEQTREQRLQGLEPLDLGNCCNLSLLPIEDDAPAPSFRVEMLLGEPVLRMPSQVVRLRSGFYQAPLDDEQVMQVARTWAAGNAPDARPVSAGVIERDQWTIQSASRNQPIHHIEMNDRAGTEIYINGDTGEVFQKTTRRERVLSWFGVIPHWLYPTLLRQNGALWVEVVIWASIAGTFLAATGLYVGLGRVKTRRDRLRVRPVAGSRVSPYRGLWYWHHMLGLVFGVLTLTWVFSGLMTMNPWGALTGGGGQEYREALVGQARWGDVRQFLGAASDAQQRGDLPETLKSLESRVFGGELQVMAGTVMDSTVVADRGAVDSVAASPVIAPTAPLRLDVTAEPASPVTAARVAELLQDAWSPREVILMESEDAYYYAHKSPIELPVVRVTMDDAEGTRIYVGHESANVRVLTDSARTSRWIRTGLHRLDFAFMKSRPVWDILVILLLIGVTCLCATGTWMSFQRIRHDFKALRQSRRRHGAR